MQTDYNKIIEIYDELDIKKVPRYTSYPTAVHFKPNFDVKMVENWLVNIKDQEISMYIHIPFCRKLCTFCACNMKVVNTYGPIKTYLKLLKKEIEMYASFFKNNNVTIGHLHFGGGSPTAVNGDDFDDLMLCLYNNFDFTKNAKIAIEIDPRTVDFEKLSIYKKHGFNRASIGVQDFDQKVQETVNRVQSFELVSSVIKDLRNLGFNSINIDLMYGLPYQTMQTIENTMLNVMKLDIDRASVFGYAHVPWMAKGQTLIPEETLADGGGRFKMFELIKNMFLKNGYASIGLDHFVKKEDAMNTAFNEKKLHRNFQGYTTDYAKNMIGLGQSSIACFDNGYVQNFVSPTDYKIAIEKGVLPIAKGILITKEDKMRREIINHIMCYMEVDYQKIIDTYDIEIDLSHEKLKIDQAKNLGIIECDGTKIKLKEEYHQFLRIIAAIFDNKFENNLNRHSSSI